MAEAFQFDHKAEFSLENAAEILRAIPTTAGVFALRGERDIDQPYLTRAADLRRRITRMLAPPDSPADAPPITKRLNLREKVCSIDYTVTGSEFESLLLLYRALAEQFGVAEARRRMRLHTPFFLRLTLQHSHPRVYTTNRLARRSLDETYGPFPSRLAAERYCDSVLDLFKLRRCHEDLEVHPEHPGCAYGEMKRCMAPCNVSCTAEQYAMEAKAVHAFFETHGESMLSGLATERDKASEEMDFERAATTHAQFARVKAAASLADELVRPIPRLRAVIVQRAPTLGDEACVFLLDAGCLTGPGRLSTLGVRAVKEQTSVGSSLFAQPLMLQAIPLEDGPALTTSDSPELRAEHLIAELTSKAASTSSSTDLALMADHLSLFRRWYYRPEKQRPGEVFLPHPDGSWPLRRILRGAARMALGDPKPMAETQRDQVDAAKVRILHEGREGVERVVPLIASPRARRKTKPQDLQPAQSPGETLRQLD